MKIYCCETLVGGTAEVQKPWFLLPYTMPSSRHRTEQMEQKNRTGEEVFSSIVEQRPVQGARFFSPCTVTAFELELKNVSK